MPGNSEVIILMEVTLKKFMETVFLCISKKELDYKKFAEHIISYGGIEMENVSPIDIFNLFEENFSNNREEFCRRIVLCHLFVDSIMQTQFKEQR